ncbi:cytochrome aa3 quinol oxidase subunit II [Virgibacillus flavescens]|uniref:cytochrome aa3 quinol oxidase subunit II n=1 Tax=Virgibacillus flavescens TaxID=1611422 RepID=UPI003D35180F
MKRKIPHRKKWLALVLVSMVFFLSGCGDLVVFEPKGPVAQSQKDLIIYSLYYMAGIIVVVFAAFAIILVKYRDHPNRKKESYDPNLHGNNMIEAIWIIIPIIIVTLLSIPTVTTLYDLEDAPDSTSDKEPLVVYATSANWKWFFSYPEENIETVNYLHIPTDRAIEFRLTSTGSMASIWIPALGGQKYNMAGMMNKLYLQSDEEGVFQGRNSNFTGEGFTMQTFDVNAESQEEFDAWVKEKQSSAPKLTQKKYDNLLKPGLVEKMTFSSTHREWVKHGTPEGMDYFIKRYADAYEEPLHLDIEDAKEYKEENGK